MSVQYQQTVLPDETFQFVKTSTLSLTLNRQVVCESPCRFVHRYCSQYQERY
jgi:hypothetical protein